MINPECGVAPFSLPVGPSGAISGSMRMYEYNCAPVSASLTGRVSGNTLVLEIRGNIRSSKGSLSKRSETADADARRKAEEDERKAAEAAEAGEAALRLSLPDRQKIQVALTSQGFDTRGADGTFGARSREMIAAWQRSRGHPATGYLTAVQQQALLRAASTALSKFDDDERKKAEEAKRKADDEARARAAPPPAIAALAPPMPATSVPAAPAVSAAPATAFDGTYSGSLSSSTPTGGQGAMRPLAASLRVAGGQVTGETVNVECGAMPISLPVGPSGAISGTVGMYEFNCTRGTASFTGRVNGSTLVVEIRGIIRSAKGSLNKRSE